MLDHTEGAAFPIPDREARNGDRFTRGVAKDEKDNASCVTVNSERISAGAVDCHTFVHQQFAGSECNDAGNTSGIDGITLVCVHERLTQRTRAVVVRISHYDRSRTRENCDRASQG